ncbi:MAG: tryptophan--tRNA ligase [Methanocellales archaeon]|nr:tryptophan--tRNA ligase [Methanocellales archaeon]MDD3420833.1 tryptophan--tRNA ligase [Methanocellales archaeon]MDD4898024.1 tryptophan--tRNA ligase [Methanocellales archaeon]MDD5446499.1 tryptophan--tRNA ligase [Methanocellales archaeon]
MMQKIKLNPWSTNFIEDYSKLFDEFGVSPFEDLLAKVPNPHPYMRRQIIFGHRDYQSILDAMHSNKPFGVMSGFMPSGPVHLGHKMVMDEIIWHQRMGADAFFGIADMEAHAVRGVSWKECTERGINEYILSLIALGFEPSGRIYFQSKDSFVKDLAFELGIEANLSEMSAIYGFSGETNISHMVSALVQSADILHAQLRVYGGPKPVVIPVGFDQDPHIRLTRDIASRMRMFKVEQREDYISVRAKHPNKEAMYEIADSLEGDVKIYAEHVDIYDNKDVMKIESVVRAVEIEHGGYGLLLPSSIYHRFMSGLTGGKMSSSSPDSIIALTESPDVAAEKVKKAKTGGRVTLTDQRKLGGEPQKCTAYELLLFHLIEDDAHIAQIFTECKEGKRTCGSCKALAAELMVKFLKEHQDGRERAKERLDEYGLKL